MDDIARPHMQRQFSNAFFFCGVIVQIETTNLSVVLVVPSVRCVMGACFAARYEVRSWYFKEDTTEEAWHTTIY